VPLTNCNARAPVYNSIDMTRCLTSMLL